ncbi:MAG: hypothetical protein J7K68_02045 [Candidatus Diapherotrites archaeon]|nr:hypothetical protein [Candidatus Diapherotrites archaeon]
MDPQKADIFLSIIAVLCALPILIYIAQRISGHVTVDLIWPIVTGIVLILIIFVKATRRYE